jgi:hypothetical protein
LINELSDSKTPPGASNAPGGFAATDHFTAQF